MLFDTHEGFDVPMEERLMIYPDARRKLFINMVENYKIFYPNLKMIYGGLNYDSDLKVDYLVIFEAPGKNGRPMILWDAPYAYTNRSIPSYRYAVKTNQHAKFFQECVSHFGQLAQGKFYEFITSGQCGDRILSLNPRDANYWKSPNNAPALIQGMSEINLMYVPDGYKNRPRPKIDINNLPSARSLVTEGFNAIVDKK